MKIYASCFLGVMFQKPLAMSRLNHSLLPHCEAGLRLLCTATVRKQGRTTLCAALGQIGEDNPACRLSFSHRCSRTD